MPELHLRLRNPLYNQLKESCAQRGIKVSKAVRDFIEKGLAEHHVQDLQTNISSSPISYFDRKMGEYIIESMVLIRKIILQSLNNDMEKTKETISEAAIKARAQIDKILADGSNLD